ncbi:hypothetical protein HWV62_34455, partial [Athelia sp. TMB]
SYPQAKSEPADLSALLALSQAGPIPTSASALPPPAIGNIANLWQSLLKAGVVSSTGTPTGAGETAKVEETKVEAVDPSRLAAREYRKSILAQKMKLTKSTSGKKDMQDHLAVHFRQNHSGQTAKAEEIKVDAVDPSRLAAREYRKSILAQKMKLTSAAITK